jgi:hypothetical protein
MTLDREQTFSLGALALILVVCACLVQYAMQSRSEAAQQLGERRDTLARLEARARVDGPGRTITTAPASAFLDASTQGLAGAQLQAYLTQTAGAQQAAIISSGLEPTKREDTPDTIRLQATFEVGGGAAGVLYRLETGTPYVFVSAGDPARGRRRTTVRGSIVARRSVCAPSNGGQLAVVAVPLSLPSWCYPA